MRDLRFRHQVSHTGAVQSWTVLLRVPDWPFYTTEKTVDRAVSLSYRSITGLHTVQTNNLKFENGKNVIITSQKDQGWNQRFSC